MFKKMKTKDYILYSVIILSGILLDQLTKLLAVKFLKEIDTLPIIKDVLHLTYLENRGMALGLLENHRWIFISVSTVTIAALLVFVFGGFSQKKLYTVPLSLIISGGIGNMIDRLALGYVIDFIDFRLIDFYVFNGADSFVCVGAALLVIVLLRDVIEESKKEKSGKSE